MFIRKLNQREEITARDNTVLRELFNPLKDDLELGYSLAHAVVRPGDITYPHRLTGSEVYYILEGEGEMYVDDQMENISSGQAVYIPPNSVQKIKNVGLDDLKFLCLVDPPWKAENEEIL
jgi:mannose-6-phosphate isomerase-like protein (cupin superfamily)